jgi:hypothetical protein
MNEEYIPIKVLDDPLEDGVVVGNEYGSAFIARDRLPFKTVAFFWDSWCTWHMDMRRNIAMHHWRQEKAAEGEHAVLLLSGFRELLRIVVDACYRRRPLPPIRSWSAGYYCFDLPLDIFEASKLHMILHDLAAEINPSLVSDRGCCCICPMAKVFGSIIHSGLADAWGHPMTWHGMADGNREGLFLVGLFRMALRQAAGAGLSPMDRERLGRCYALLMHLFYLTRVDAEHRLAGGVPIGMQQFQHEVECVLDSTGSSEAFSLLGFGGKQLMRLRNMRDPKILEELMEQEKTLIQQHAGIIINDYSRRVRNGFIGDSSGPVYFNDAEPRQQEESPRKISEEALPQKKLTGANPPNREVKNLIRTLLEKSEEGFSTSGLFYQLQANDATIPEWVQGKDQVKSYISSFIGALRKDLESEKKTITKSPYRIIPSDDA